MNWPFLAVRAAKSTQASQHEEFERLVRDSGLIIERRMSCNFYWSTWWFFFWICKQELSPPWHPLLNSWLGRAAIDDPTTPGSRRLWTSYADKPGKHY